jgi:carboxypeptidase C (cathepsin A)
MKILDLVLFIVIFSEVATVDQGDWVDTFKLPIGYLTHPFFAGYLNISSSHAYYYNYFPSESNPGKDPLIVRISAGPGCSALYSTFYSKGPFIFVRNTKNFRVNPNNWNK